MKTRGSTSSRYIIVPVATVLEKQGSRNFEKHKEEHTSKLKDQRQECDLMGVGAHLFDREDHINISQLPPLPTLSPILDSEADRAVSN